MSGAREQVTSMKSEATPDGEVIFQGKQRTARSSGSTSSEVVVNVPEEARDIIGIEEGDTLSVDIYRGHLEIRPDDE